MASWYVKRTFKQIDIPIFPCHLSPRLPWPCNTSLFSRRLEIGLSLPSCQPPHREWPEFMIKSSNSRYFYNYSLTKLFIRDICLAILAIFLPPLAVLLRRGCGADLCINIILTLMGDIPGIIHALWVMISVVSLIILPKPKKSLKR